MGPQSLPRSSYNCLLLVGYNEGHHLKRKQYQNFGVSFRLWIRGGAPGKWFEIYPRQGRGVGDRLRNGEAVVRYSSQSSHYAVAA